MHVLTLIAPPATALTVAALDRAARELGAAQSLWLAAEEAADLYFTTPPSRSAIATAVGDAPIDAVLQEVAGRRKQLLVADMDSTILSGETLDELAAHAGLKPQIAAITARSMSGEIDFRQSLIQRVALLRGLPLSALSRTWAETKFTPGARELVATMRQAGASCALLTGGFTFFAERAAAELGFDHYRANHLRDNGVALAGEVAEPILDRRGKSEALRTIAAAHGLVPSQALAVGDGANDLDMLMSAGLGVAFHAQPIVAAQATARIDHCDLRALLFMQGFQPPFIERG